LFLALTLCAACRRDTRAARAHFELLKRAYVDARYSEHFEITKDQLEWLRGCVGELETT